jgi:hypothetical protein
MIRRANRKEALAIGQTPRCSHLGINSQSFEKPNIGAPARMEDRALSGADSEKQVTLGSVLNCRVLS